MATWKTVQEIASTLPETEESTSYGTPALKVKGKGFVRLRTEEKGPNTLAIFTTEKEALLSDDRGIYFTTPHYDNAPMVCIQLSKIGKRELREVLADAWRMKAPPKVRKDHPDV